MRKILEIFLAASVIALGNYLLNPSRPIYIREISHSPEICAPEWIIVDARSRQDFALGHLENAINLSEADFESQISDFLDLWAPGVKVAVYCNPENCNSSMYISKKLVSEYEISDVFILKGDWRKWKK